MGRILVVDDNPQIARLVEFRLAREGHEVVVVHSGAEAIASAAARRPDLVVLDIMMPGMDGYEVLRTFRDRRDLAFVPVILLSGLGEEHHVVQGLKSGAQDYMTKPFSPSELAARVEKLLAA